MASEGFQSSHWYVTDLTLGLQIHHLGLVIIAMVVVFIILFMSFLLCNFLRQCNEIMSITGSNGFSSDSGAVAAAVHVRNKGLDEATINSLPIFLHRALSSSDTSFQESECSICLCSFEENESVKVIPRCLHLYHSECVDKWLQSRAICPLCRGPLHSSTALEVEPSA